MSNSAITPVNAVQPASASAQGIVTTTAQVFAGAKTFDGGAIIKGSTSGGVVSTGYVGEYVSDAAATDTTTTTANTDIDTDLSIDLTAGVWMIGYNASISIANSDAATRTIWGRTRITDSANTAVSNTEALVSLSMATGVASRQNTSRTVVVSTSSSKTYKLRIACSDATATGSATLCSTSQTSSLTNPDTSSVLWAVRIA